MKLPRQIMFSDEEELTDEEKIKLLDKAAAGGLVLGGLGAFSSLAYLSNHGRHQNVPKSAIRYGVPTAIAGLALAGFAKHKKNELLQKKNENKKRKSSK